MFRLLFAPKATPGKGEIVVLDQVYSTFNRYTVDLENRKLRVSLDPNRQRFENMTYEEMIKCEKEAWDVKNFNYTIDEWGNLEIVIPENHEVLVILK